MKSERVWAALVFAAAVVCAGAPRASAQRKQLRGGPEPGPAPAVGSPMKPPPPLSGPDSERKLRIEVWAEYKGLSGEADFVTSNATQANMVEGGDKAFKLPTSQGQGVEFKKFGFIVNTLPVLVPDDDSRVDLQFQSELSGPRKSEAGQDIITWQWQSEFTLELGKKTRVVKKPAVVDIRITRAD